MLKGADNHKGIFILAGEVFGKAQAVDAGYAFCSG